MADTAHNEYDVQLCYFMS